MTHNLIKHIQASHLRNCPDIRPGYSVKVHQRIKEGNKERVQVFSGLVIKLNSGHGTDRTFTVRNIVSGVGVEKTFPCHSCTIEKIEITKIAKVRRAKLYFMRERSGKSARLKETHVSIIGDMQKLAKEEEVMPEEMEMEVAEMEVSEEVSATEDNMTTEETEMVSEKEETDEKAA